MEKWIIIFLCSIPFNCVAEVLKQPKPRVTQFYQDSTEKLVSYFRVEQRDAFKILLYLDTCITPYQTKYLLSPKIKVINPFNEEFQYQSKLLNMPFRPENTIFLEFKVPANKELVLNFNKNKALINETKSCNIQAVYKFKPNKNYELLDSDLKDSCVLKVNEILKNGVRKEHKPIEVFSKNNESGSCDAKRNN